MENGVVVMENRFGVPQKVRELPYDLAILLLDTFPKEMKAQTQIPVQQYS